MKKLMLMIAVMIMMLNSVQASDIEYVPLTDEIQSGSTETIGWFNVSEELENVSVSSSIGFEVNFTDLNCTVTVPSGYPNKEIDAAFFVSYLRPYNFSKELTFTNTTVIYHFNESTGETTTETLTNETSEVFSFTLMQPEVMEIPIRFAVKGVVDFRVPVNLSYSAENNETIGLLLTVENLGTDSSNTVVNSSGFGLFTNFTLLPGQIVDIDFDYTVPHNLTPGVHTHRVTTTTRNVSKDTVINITVNDTLLPSLNLSFSPETEWGETQTIRVAAEDNIATDHYYVEVQPPNSSLEPWVYILKDEIDNKNTTVMGIYSVYGWLNDTSGNEIEYFGNYSIGRLDPMRINTAHLDFYKIKNGTAATEAIFSIDKIIPLTISLHNLTGISSVRINSVGNDPVTLQNEHNFTLDTAGEVYLKIQSNLTTNFTGRLHFSVPEYIKLPAEDIYFYGNIVEHIELEPYQTYLFGKWPFNCTPQFGDDPNLAKLLCQTEYPGNIDPEALVVPVTPGTVEEIKQGYDYRLEQKGVELYWAGVWFWVLVAIIIVVLVYFIYMESVYPYSEGG